jgi:peptide/nickel transport system substrate-binding protein/oligopeptide transport system substrate-binding protein
MLLQFTNRCVRAAGLAVVVLALGLGVYACAGSPGAAQAVPAETGGGGPGDGDVSGGAAASGNDGGEEPRYAEARPEVINREDFTVVFYGDYPELDPRMAYIASEAQLATALYEGLFSYHPITMEPVPAAAQDWRVSPDKKVWTFTLRENARYSNGDPLRAQDFRDTWISLLDPRRNSPYSSLFDVIAGAKEFRLGTLVKADKVGIRAVNDRTLEITLNAPAGFFPFMLCHHSFSPVHPSLLADEHGDAAPSQASRTPRLSNGPFVLESSRAADGEITLVLVKNDNYWDAENVALSRLIVRYTEDEDDPTHYWNSGEARWVAGAINPDILTDRSGIVVNAIFATHYYFIRSVREPWGDHRLRKALAITTPWDQIREGIYLPAKTLIYPLPGYPEVAGFEEADPEQGRALLAEAGYPGGMGLPELVIRINPNPGAARIAGIMAAAWLSELGVKTRIDIVPFNRYFESIRLLDYDIGSMSWIGDFADPYSFLQMWRRDSNLNDARYSDNDYELLMERSMAEEGEKRWQTLADAETLLLDRGTVLPISFSAAANLISLNEVDGWYPNALDIHPFKYLAFKAYRPLPGVTMNTNTNTNKNEEHTWMR